MASDHPCYTGAPKVGPKVGWLQDTLRAPYYDIYISLNFLLKLSCKGHLVALHSYTFYHM